MHLFYKVLDIESKTEFDVLIMILLVVNRYFSISKKNLDQTKLNHFVKIFEVSNAHKKKMHKILHCPGSLVE